MSTTQTPYQTPLPETPTGSVSSSEPTGGAASTTGAPTVAYRAARDQLLALRGDHARALAEFAWPDVGGTFNWAHDWFDAVARGNDRAALVIVDEDGSTTRRSYDEMARRADQVRGGLSTTGVGRGRKSEAWEKSGEVGLESGG